MPQIFRIKHRMLIFPLISMLLGLSACQQEVKSVIETNSVKSTGYSAEINRTKHNIPHIIAQDLPSAWFGQGYAMAEDRICPLLDQVIKVRSERSQRFGAGDYDINIEFDFAYKHLGIYANSARNFAALPNDIIAMLTAHAAGINQFIMDNDKLPTACRDKSWRLQVTPVDLLAIATDFNIFLSGRFLVSSLSNVAPPVKGMIKPTPPMSGLVNDKSMLGSNGWGVGGDLTQSGHGILLAQPHFPWEGAMQGWESHVTVPGELDVYGITVPGIPNMLVGFNVAVAWTLTVTTSPKATLYDLTLVPGKPTQYRYDGQIREMEENEYTLDVLDKDGKLIKKSRKLWSSHYGPMLAIPAAFTAGKADYSWNNSHALTYRDANIDNRSMLSQFLAMSRSKDMDSFVKAHQQWAGSIPFSNTIATSVSGEVWYADSSPVPNISSESYQAWQKNLQSDAGKAALFSFHGIYVLDGSSSRDEWQYDPTARVAGFIPFAKAPQHWRKDFVFNANDSHWLTNPNHPLEGFNPLFGEERAEISMRTRMNAQALAKATPEHKFTLADVQAAALSNQSLTANLLRSELVDRCKHRPNVKLDDTQVNLKPACDVLAQWDEHYDLHSKGAVLFREFLGAFESVGQVHAGASANSSLFAKAFDFQNPITTPQGLAPPPKRGIDPILIALAQAVKTLTNAGFALDISLGELQFSQKNKQRIPIHGGQGNEGIMNMAAFSGASDALIPGMGRGKLINSATGLTDQGYAVNYGTSFLLAVELKPEGPNCQALLSFSQSADPDSPYFADQTTLFSQKQWRPCLFKQTDVLADPSLRQYQVKTTIR